MTKVERLTVKIFLLVGSGMGPFTFAPVMEAVKRAMSTPVDVPPVDSYSQAAGPYSENYRFTNPSGDLWFKKTELKALGISGNQIVDSITPNTRRDIYGE